MSLALLQGYSSAEEEEETIGNGTHYQNSSDDDDGGETSVVAHPSLCDRSMFDLPQPSTAPGLPSAFDAFSEVILPFLSFFLALGFVWLLRILWEMWEIASVLILG